MRGGVPSAHDIFIYKDFGIVAFDRASDGGVLFLVWWASMFARTI